MWLCTWLLAVHGNTGTWDRLTRVGALLEDLELEESIRRRSTSVGTYDVEECTWVQRSCTDLENCAGDVTCTGPDDSTCSQCEAGFEGETCTPIPPPPTPLPTRPPTPSPTSGDPPQYQKLDYGVPPCAADVEITTQDECREAITSLGVTGFATWTGGNTGMPRFCSIQKDTNTMIWNTNAMNLGGRHDLAPVCKSTASPNPPTPAPTAPDTPQYQKLNMYWNGCPSPEFEITTQEECRQAIISLGVTGFTIWTGSRPGMPRLCSIQKDTNSMIWNTIDVGAGRWDLAPVCKWTGTPTPPEPTPSPIPESRDLVTVHPEEWEYFLAFQESRKNGFSCPCGDLDWISCNEIERPGTHWHPPNPEKLTYDCTLWVATYRHAEDQAIQDYCAHNAKDYRSPRQRAEAIGAVSTGEHSACRYHTTGPGALAGLQTSPGHCNSMYDPKFRGVAVGWGSAVRNVWTVNYNGGGDDITDSESCIPDGYTATGDLK